MDKEDLYKKLTERGERTVGKANKGINVEKNSNRSKRLKNNNSNNNNDSSPELQKPNIEAEIYNNKKCDWERKEKRLKCLVRLHSANKMDSYSKGGRKEKKIQKNLQNKSKHRNIKCFSWVTAVRVLSLAGCCSPPHLPRMPPTLLISGPAVGAAQILIWSYPCGFLPPMSTAIRASVFSFVRVLNGLSYIP